MSYDNCVSLPSCVISPAALGTLEFELRYEQSSSELHCTVLRAKVKTPSTPRLCRRFWKLRSGICSHLAAGAFSPEHVSNEVPVFHQQNQRQLWICLKYHFLLQPEETKAGETEQTCIKTNSQCFPHAARCTGSAAPTKIHGN